MKEKGLTESQLPYSQLKQPHRVAGRCRLASFAVLLAGVMTVALLLGAPPEPAPPVLACYYTTGGDIQPTQLKPAVELCSHIIIGFARVKEKILTLDPGQAETIAGVVALRGVNPRLKVMLSVGGAGGDHGFVEMVENHASRKLFIRSVRDTMRNLSLNGLDLDWEFPGVGIEAGLADRQRQHFSQLVHELRTEFLRWHHPPLLTVAAAAPDPIADAAYDVDQLDLYTDWVNVMSYDYHFYSKITPFTGHNSPLFPRSDELSYLGTLNVNHTAHAYLLRGLRPERMALGVPTYGHSFTLVSSTGAQVGSPAKSFGTLGVDGFVTQQDLCEWLRNHTDAITQRDSESRVPFVTHDTEWISYEDEASIRDKAGLVQRLGLAGAMLYCLNSDDPLNKCGGGSYPMTRALHAALVRRAIPPLWCRHSPAAATRR